MNFEEFKKQYQKRPVKEYLNTAHLNPVVSVCVQTYQHAPYIKECLDEILMQKTDFDFEILLGEDDSTDGTREICIDYANRYPDKIRLFLHHRENNIKIGGQPSGRFNFLYNLFSARGKYIALCEGDDYWTDPLKLQKQVDFLEENEEYVICFTNGSVIYSNSKKKLHLIYNNVSSNNQYKNFKIPIKSTSIFELANGNYIHTPGVTFKNIFKDIELPDFLSKVTIGDWPLYMSLTKFGKIFFLNENTFCYRVHTGGVYSEKSTLDKYKMTLGQFEPMIASGYFDSKELDLIKQYCMRSFLVYLKYCKIQEDLNFANKFIETIKQIDHFFYEQICHKGNKISGIKINNGCLRFENSFDKYFKKINFKLKKLKQKIIN